MGLESTQHPLILNSYHHVNIIPSKLSSTTITNYKLEIEREKLFQMLTMEEMTINRSDARTSEMMVILAGILPPSLLNTMAL